MVVDYGTYNIATYITKEKKRKTEKKKENIGNEFLDNINNSKATIK